MFVCECQLELLEAQDTESSTCSLKALDSQSANAPLYPKSLKKAKYLIPLYFQETLGSCLDVLHMCNIPR